MASQFPPADIKSLWDGLEQFVLFLDVRGSLYWEFDLACANKDKMRQLLTDGLPLLPRYMPDHLILEQLRIYMTMTTVRGQELYRAQTTYQSAMEGPIASAFYRSRDDVKLPACFSKKKRVLMYFRLEHDQDRGTLKLGLELCLAPNEDSLGLADAPRVLNVIGVTGVGKK